MATLKRDQFLQMFAGLLKVLKVEAGIPQARQSRPDVLGGSLSPPLSRDVSAGPSTRVAESPRTFANLDVPRLSMPDQNQEKRPNSVNNYYFNGHSKEPAYEQNSTSYALSLSTPSTLPTTNTLGSQLSKIPGLAASALNQAAPDPSTPSPGWNTTAKVALGVGIPTALAGTVGALSSAANVGVAKQTASKTIELGAGNLAETKAKNIQDQRNKEAELSMAKRKHDLK